MCIDFVVELPSLESNYSSVHGFDKRVWRQQQKQPNQSMLWLEAFTVYTIYVQHVIELPSLYVFASPSVKVPTEQNADCRRKNRSTFNLVFGAFSTLHGGCDVRFALYSNNG